MLFKLSPPKWPHQYDEDPATVCSSVNWKVRNISARLASNMSASTIISTIRRREVVHRLYLGNSCLGDVGCVRLFEYLNSPAGRECKESLTELFLTNNEIGSQGLLAVAAFLRDNAVLRELCLSGNPLTTDPAVIAEFASALNSSRLCTLQLLHSSSLGDPFVQAFLPRLTTLYLRQLDMSAISMTHFVVPLLIDYVKSPRCSLERLQCNANSLTLQGARLVINAIQESNYSLCKVNLDDLHVHEDDGAGEERTLAWQQGWRVLSAAMQRNLRLKVQVKEQSLVLLRCCRALFLRSGTEGVSGRAVSFASVSSRNRNSRAVDGPSRFFDLPTEIQQEIIAFIAPVLSHQQRMRIVRFAADVSTLPEIDHKLRAVRGRTRNLESIIWTGLGKRPVSQQKPFEGSWRPPTWWECQCPSGAQATCRCLRRWRRERRDIWVTQVACDAWEPAS
ncbi:hypothetical protein F5I97DRAFT_1073310 [Phlebopus sp. FC_14]|nr:hypothetical protein F5I97DRAFT_1073310 [Phlebopus sp. FC_14]